MLIHSIVKENQSCSVSHEQMDPLACYRIETNCNDEKTSPRNKLHTCQNVNERKKMITLVSRAIIYICKH